LSSPRKVRLRTSFFPRRSSLVNDRPSMLMSGVTLPISRRRLATFSVMNWPLVKTLKVAVRMRRQQIEQAGMHERFAAEDAEERVAVLLRFRDGAVERLEIDGVLFLDVHPAALTAEIAGVDDRKVEERGKVFAAFDAALEALDGEQPFTPKFQQNFQSRRGSVVRRIRVARAGNMAFSDGRQMTSACALGNSCAQSSS
jgi:hypothetical protein